MNTVKQITFCYSHSLLPVTVKKVFNSIDGLIWGMTLLNITRRYGTETSSNIKYNLIDETGVRVNETSQFSQITDYIDNNRALLAYATLNLSESNQNIKYLLSFFVHSNIPTNDPAVQNQFWWVEPKEMIIEYNQPSTPIHGKNYITSLEQSDFMETEGLCTDYKNGIFICTDHASSLQNGSLQILKWYYNLHQNPLKFFSPAREQRVIRRIQRYCATNTSPICNRIPSPSPSLPQPTFELNGDDLESLVTEVGVAKFEDQDWKEPVLFKTGRSNTYSEKIFGSPTDERSSLIQI